MTRKITNISPIWVRGLRPNVRCIDALVRCLSQLWMLAHVVIVRGTQKLLKRLSGPVASDADRSSTMLRLICHRAVVATT